VVTRLCDLTIGQYSVLSGWLGVSHGLARLVDCEQPFYSTLKGSVVGATGQALKALHDAA